MNLEFNILILGNALNVTKGPRGGYTEMGRPNDPCGERE